MNKMIELLQRGETFAVASVLRAKGSPGRIGHKMIVRFDGSTIGTVGGGSVEEQVKADAMNALKKGEGIFKAYDLSQKSPTGIDSLCGGRQDMAIEIVPGRPHLLIMGAGHMGRSISDLCRLLDYGYSVVDDRAELTNRDDWDNAQGVFCSDPAEFLRTADVTPYTHLLIMNYTHQLDGESLQAALERFPGIIGMIGSTRKRDAIYKSLSDKLREKTSSVRCPVGLTSIPARSPAEIAVAILGEIIGDRYGA